MRVCVEGNIGSGKTTALEALAQARPDLRVFTEPLHDWGDLIRNFYDDPSRWSLALSLRALLAFREPGATSGEVLVERSCLSNRHVFSQLLFNENKMAQAEWELFKEYYDVLAWTPDVMVYIDTPADVCLERVQQRNRPGEAKIDVQYLRRLEFQYETMLRYADVPVVRVDGTMPPDAVAQAVAAVFEP